MTQTYRSQFISDLQLTLDGIFASTILFSERIVVNVTKAVKKVEEATQTRLDKRSPDSFYKRLLVVLAEDASLNGAVRTFMGYVMEDIRNKCLSKAVPRTPNLLLLSGKEFSKILSILKAGISCDTSQWEDFSRIQLICKNTAPKQPVAVDTYSCNNCAILHYATTGILYRSFLPVFRVQIPPPRLLPHATDLVLICADDTKTTVSFGEASFSCSPIRQTRFSDFRALYQSIQRHETASVSLNPILLKKIMGGILPPQSKELSHCDTPIRMTLGGKNEAIQLQYGSFDACIMPIKTSSDISQTSASNQTETHS